MSEFMVENSEDPEEELLFYGRDGVECENFIRALRQRAFNLGKHRDFDWIAAYASTCFAGTSLRWFEGLDDEVQCDWNLLRRAMLEKYPAPADRVRPAAASATVATPTAAPPQSAAVLSSFLNLGPRIGRIRVVADTPANSGYVGRSLRLGFHEVIRSSAEALLVRFTPSTECHTLTLRNSSSTYESLGMTWHSKEPRLGLGSPDNGFLAAVSGSERTSFATSVQLSRGPSRSAIWLVLPDGTVSIKWTGDSGVKFDIEAVIYLPDKRILLASDYDAMIRNRKLEHTRARFVFEPV